MMGAQVGESASTDLLRLLGDPDGAKRRLQDLEAATKASREAAAAAAEAVEKAEEAKAGLAEREAQCAEVEERQKRTEAELAKQADHLREKERKLAADQKEIERLGAESLKQLAAREAVVGEIRSTLEARELQMGQWSEKRERELTERERRVEEALRSAEALRVQYEKKISNLREILS